MVLIKQFCLFFLLAERRVYVGVAVIRWTETQVKISDGVAPCLLDV